jgi:hypothetical protein
VGAAAKIVDDAAQRASVRSSRVHARQQRAAAVRRRHRDGAFVGKPAASGARVRHERRRQTQAPWSCDRTAQAFAALQERRKPSDMRASLAEGTGGRPTPLRWRDFESREGAWTGAHARAASDQAQG